MSVATPLVLDADHPWPGLESYDEANRDFFKGREEEKEALLRLVERETLSVLYGRSGLGKTSLVQAGLFPQLRQLDYAHPHPFTVDGRCRQLNSRRSPPKVLLSFREDYLADFEGLDDFLRGRTSAAGSAKMCARHHLLSRLWLTDWLLFFGKSQETASPVVR